MNNSRLEVDRLKIQVGAKISVKIDHL